MTGAALCAPPSTGRGSAPGSAVAKRTGFIHGWPGTAMFHCSAISLSNKWAHGHSGVMEGQVSVSRVENTRSSPWERSMRTATNWKPEAAGLA